VAFFSSIVICHIFMTRLMRHHFLLSLSKTSATKSSQLPIKVQVEGEYFKSQHLLSLIHVYSLTLLRQRKSSQCMSNISCTCTHYRQFYGVDLILQIVLSCLNYCPKSPKPSRTLLLWAVWKNPRVPWVQGRSPEIFEVVKAPALFITWSFRGNKWMRGHRETVSGRELASYREFVVNISFERRFSCFNSIISQRWEVGMDTS
jgi:hypothetical protein